MVLSRTFLKILLPGILWSSSVLCQLPTNTRSNLSMLVDEFGKISAEDRTSRFDGLFEEIKNHPDSVGFVFVFCGQTCRYGEVEAHLRGIELKIAGSQFSHDRLVILAGGYRKEQTAELWIKTPGAFPPTPRSTVRIKNVSFTKATNRILEPYDCCDDNGYLWKTFKP